MPSNVENILNAILTGDGSGIQKPASRVEELLFEIYEQGGGGGGDSVIGGIKLTIDSDYVMTATLVDKDGEEYGVSDDIDLPLEEMVVDAEYDPQTQKIKLELKNGNYVEFSVAELVSGLQTELSSDNKLNPAYIAYDASHRAVSDTEKNTWNAKQNAISDLEAIRSGAAAGATAVQPSTMEAALNAKQNSLSETQLAAVNSGINSTKVGQISTNQANILYGLQTGVKNSLVSTNGTTLFTGIQYTRNADDSITVSGSNTASSRTVYSITSGTEIEKAGHYIPNNHVGEIFSIGDVVSDNDCYVVIFYSNNGSTWTNEEMIKGTSAVHATIKDYPYYNICICVTEGKTISPARTFYPMICPQSVYNVDPSYQPPALPNSDLTYLEAEDRAALAEVVDSGAKNLVDLADKTLTTSGYVYDKVAIPALPKGSYAFSAVFSSGIASSQISLWDANNNEVGRFNPTDTYFTTTGTATKLTFWVNLGSGQSSGTVSSIMLCTKAASDVSQKFVPYRYDPYTTVSQNVVNTTLYARRNGRTVTVNGYVDNLSLTAGSNTLLGTINDEIGKPLQQIRAVCSVGQNAYTFGEAAYIAIAPDGNIVVTPKTYSGTGAVFFSVSYTI